MSDPVIIDISHYQDTPDWQALKAGGVGGVILKATEGTGYVDKTFAGRYEDAINAGLAVASYHFFNANNVEAQMNLFLNTVQPRPGERMVIDHEADASLAELEQAVAYLQSDSRNIQVTVYSGHLIKDQVGSGYSEILAGTSLWIAQYTSASEPSWPKGTWPTWTLWQYTDAAEVDGIAGLVDGNRFNGTDDDALLWLDPAGMTPEPRPTAVDMVVELSIGMGLTYAILVNGVQVAADEAR